SRLALWCTWARNADIASPRIRAWRGLINQDWGLMTDACAQIVLGWSKGEVGRCAAEHLRASVTPDTARAALGALRAFDVTPILRDVQAPTLVLHRREISWLPVDVARSLASGIRGARLTVLEGESTAPYLGETAAAVRAIDEFLSHGESTGARARRHAGRSLAALEREPAIEEWAGMRQDRTRTYPNGLTEREVQVLCLIAAGRTNKEIAGELVLSIRTVERHIANIYGKIGARGRADATVFALTRKLQASL
ncbi:MAG: LuxR C-terminal-related transcriptional regulator, partial [bacterium]